jgi:hypothetical protein
MTPETRSPLLNPSPKDHVVYTSTDENLFVEAVSVFTGAGLRKNEGVILIMTVRIASFMRMVLLALR